MTRTKLMLLLLFLSLVAFCFFNQHNFIKAQSKDPKSPTLLCDKGPNCSKHQEEEIPKGVCIPGGLSCT